MVVKMSFGTILREAREQKGLDLMVVARRLRIRPDILETIEDSDFSRMPPRGFTRNMVNAYAHFLGLNATDLVRMYLDECYAYQVGLARAHESRKHGFDMGEASHSGELREGNLGRRRFSDAYRSQETSRMERLYSEQSTHKTKRGAFSDKQYTNFYAGQTKSSLSSKTPFFIAGGIILVLLVIVLALLLRPQEAPKPSEVIPVSGSEVESSNQVVEKEPTAPTSVKVSVEVLQGKKAYLEIYQDGSNKPSVADDITGPKTFDYDVANQIRIVTTNPDRVKVTQDGKDLEFEKSKKSGVYTIVVKFDEVLAAWNEEHGKTSASTTSTSSSNLEKSNVETSSSKSENTKSSNVGNTSSTSNTSSSQSNTKRSE